MVKRTGVPYVDPAHSVDTESRYIDTQQIPILCRQCVSKKCDIHNITKKHTFETQGLRNCNECRDAYDG